MLSFIRYFKTQPEFEQFYTTIVLLAWVAVLSHFGQALWRFIF